MCTESDLDRGNLVSDSTWIFETTVDSTKNDIMPAIGTGHYHK